MFKSFQDTSALQQFHGFPNLNMQQATSAYGFSGVTFWLDAAYGLNTQTNLGAVSRWQARVGGAIFEQATAGNQPRLILTDANYNNLPSVEAQSTGRALISSLNDAIKLNQSNFTLVAIAKANSQAQASNNILTPGDSPSTSFTLGGSATGLTGIAIASTPTGGTINFQTTIEDTNTHIIIFTSSNIIVDGVNRASGSITSSYINLTNIFGSTVFNRSLIGTIAEIIAFGYSMTSDEAIALSNNLNQKYAIY